MTVFISGASGFVGSHLARHLVSHGEKVVSLVHDCVGWNKWVQESLKPTVRVRGDIRDEQLLRRILNQYEVSTVYHLAAMSIVKHAYRDPVNTFDINVLGTVKLLQACRELDVERIIVQSTDKVYGNQTDAEIDSPLRPTEPYGSSKICVDVTAQAFVKTYDMNIIITRCCNIYGMDWNNRIIPNTVRACLRKESPIIFKDDKSRRQYIYIDDVLRALEYLVSERRGIFNVASNTVLDQEQVVLEILSFFPSLKPTYVDKPFLHEIKDQSMTVNIDSSGWKPEVTFREGIERTIKDFREWYLGRGVG